MRMPQNSKTKKTQHPLLWEKQIGVVPIALYTGCLHILVVVVVVVSWWCSVDIVVRLVVVSVVDKRSFIDVVVDKSLAEPTPTNKQKNNNNY